MNLAFDFPCDALEILRQLSWELKTDKGETLNHAFGTLKFFVAALEQGSEFCVLKKDGTLVLVVFPELELSMAKSWLKKFFIILRHFPFFAGKFMHKVLARIFMKIRPNSAGNAD